MSAVMRNTATMKSDRYLSPCCGAHSIVRKVSLREGVMVFRCEKCAQLRIHELGKQDPPAQPPRLRLVVNR